MEQITPELERRLQVEELWARRNVLADSMNAWRRERFRAQRSLLTRCGTLDEAPSRGAVRDSHPKPDGTMTDAPSSRGTGPVWVSGIAVFAAAMLLLDANLPYGDLVAQARTQVGTYLPYLKPQTPPRPAPSPVQAAGHADIKAEVAARIAAAMGSKAHGPDVLRALQSDPQAFDAQVRRTAP